MATIWGEEGKGGGNNRWLHTTLRALTHAVLNELVHIFHHECAEGSFVGRAFAVGEDNGCVHHTAVD